MSWLAALRPRREFVLPVLMAAFPLLYFVYRDARMGCPSGIGCPDLRHVGYAIGGLAASCVLAVGLVGTIAAYGVGTLVVEVPPWLDIVLAPIGLVVGLPFVAIAAGMTLVGSALGRDRRWSSRWRSSPSRSHSRVRGCSCWPRGRRAAHRDGLRRR